MRDLKCFDRITIKDLKIGDRSISATYSIELDGVKREYQLRQAYPEDIKDVKGIDEVGALVSLVPAINYTLFADEIGIEFPINELDLKFFRRHERNSSEGYIR